MDSTSLLGVCPILSILTHFAVASEGALLREMGVPGVWEAQYWLLKMCFDVLLVPPSLPDKETEAGLALNIAWATGL